VSLRTRPDRVHIVLALLAVYICWGATYLAIRFAVESIPPLLMAGVRFLSAGAILITLLRARGAPLPSRAQWRGIAITGALLLLGGNGGVVLAEHWGIASGLAAIGTAIVPVWVALLAALSGEPPTKLEWGGIALGLAGVALLNLEADFRASAAGAIGILLSGLCWSLGSHLGRRMDLPGGLMASAAQMLIGGAAFIAIGLMVGERITEMPTLRSAGGLLYLIVGGALIGFSAYGYLLRTVRPALATSYSYVNPAVAVLLGVTLAGERISPTGILALVVISGGVLIVILARDRASAASAREATPAVSRSQRL
jgi:drug/metabolite transporter (DMT)-like permease